MPKTAERKLTSEERCEKAFKEAIESYLPQATDPLTDEMSRVGIKLMWTGWQACWRYLESRVEEYVKS